MVNPAKYTVPPDAFNSWSGSRILDEIEVGTRVALCWILDVVYALLAVETGER